MSQLRAIIIDDNKKKREEVKSVLPDYIDSVAVGGAEGALNYIKRDAEGNLPDFIILNGDDPKNFGLYVFDWMINKSGDPEIAAIPVIVLTEDEFSDSSLEFLELGDVTFYEGEINESDLFGVINDAIEEAEFMPYPAVMSYEETKNIDRLMGHSVKAPEGGQRSVVLDMDARVANLEVALARGRKRVTQIRNLIDAAQNLKESKNDDLEFRRRKNRSVKEEDRYVIRMSSFLEKARKKANVEEEILNQMKAAAKKPAGGVIKKADQASVNKNERVITRPEHAPGGEGSADAIGRLKAKALSNPDGAFKAQGTIKVEERPKQEAPAKQADTDKRTVVIVDTDLKTRKLCTLFLTKNYNVAAFDSGIKAIDYVVRNRVDLLIINPVLSGMSGFATIQSVRMQPGGANIPVMYLVGDDYTASRTSLLGPLVAGILNKPVSQGVLSQSVNGFFENYDRITGKYT